MEQDALYLHFKDMSMNMKSIVVIGGSRGGVPGARAHKGPDSFVLTHNFFEK